MTEIISIKTRKPIPTPEDIAEAERVEQETEHKRLTEVQEFAKNEILDILNRTASLVQQGKIQGIVLMARDVERGLFLQEISMRPEVFPRSEVFSVIGCLSALKQELTDIAMTEAPVMNLDGNIVGAMVEVDNFEEYPDE